MLKNIVRLEHTIGERTFHFSCDPEATTVMVKEALTQFFNYALAIEQKAKEEAEEKAAAHIAEEQAQVAEVEVI